MLAQYLNDFPNSEKRANEELVRIEATLKSLDSKLSGEAARSVQGLLSRLRARSGASSEERIREVHLSVIGVIEEIRNLQEDSEWQQR